MKASLLPEPAAGRLKSIACCLGVLSCLLMFAFPAGASPDSSCPYGYDRPGVRIPPGIQRPQGPAGGRTESLSHATLKAQVAQSRRSFEVIFQHSSEARRHVGKVDAQGRLEVRLASRSWPAHFRIFYRTQLIGEVWLSQQGPVRFEGKRNFQLVAPQVSFRWFELKHPSS